MSEHQSDDADDLRADAPEGAPRPLRVQRVDRPAPDLLVLKLQGPELRGFLVVRLGDGEVDLGLVSERPRGRAADAITQKLRRSLVGSRFLGIDEPGGQSAALRFATKEGVQRLWFDVSTAPTSCTLTDAGDKPLLSWPRVTRGAATAGPGLRLGTIADWQAVGERLLEGREAKLLEYQRKSLMRSVTRAYRRLERKLAAIEGDAARAKDAAQMRADADLILSHLRQYAPGASSVTVDDWANGGQKRDIPIDPRLGPKQTAARLYQRARRLTRGEGIATQRWAQLAPKVEALGALRDAIAHVEESDALSRLTEQAAALGVEVGDVEIPGTTPRRSVPTERKPYRLYRGFAQRAIYVGRGAKDNDALTLRVARPHDLWLHARSVTGAHVVVPLEKNEDCPPELLVDAAMLAAYFSEMKGELRVDVQYVARRHVRKPRGAADGAVMVERDKTLTVRVDEGRLNELLTSADRDFTA